MAINSQKFLASGDSSAVMKSKETFMVPFTKLNFSNKKAKVKSKPVEIGSNKLKITSSSFYKKELEEIKITVININKLLNNQYVDTKKQESEKGRTTENEQFKQRESKLEEKPKGVKMPSLPKIGGVFGGLFERLQRFLIFTALGWLLPKLIKLLPALIQFGKIIGSLYKVIENIFGSLLDGFVGLIDLGFSIQDKIRGAIKAIGGEGAAKIFDNFNGVLGTLVNALLIAGMAFSSGLLGKDGILSWFSKKKNCCCNSILDSAGDVVSELAEEGLEEGVEEALDRKPKVKGPKWWRKLKIGAKKTWRNITKFGSGLLDKGKGILSKAGGFLSDQGKRVTGFLSDQGKKAGGFLSDRWKGITGFISDQGKRLGGAIDQSRKAIGEGSSWLAKKGSDLYKWGVEGLQSNWEKLKKLKPARILEWLEKQPGLLGKVGKGLPKLLESPLFKKLLKFVPGAGDIFNFFMDLMNGIDWRRALIRTMVGLTIDVGFDALVTALVAATPLTGGASTALAVALYAAYMAADIAAGGFGNILGDKIADFFKLPYKAGENAPPPKTPGNEGDLKDVKAALEKKKQEDPKFNEKTGGSNEKPAFETGGIVPTSGEDPTVSLKPKTFEEKTTLLSPTVTRGNKQIGGKLTRGGKEVGGQIQRTITKAKKKVKRPSKVKSKRSKPGVNVSGGEKLIIKLYNGSKKNDDKKNGYLALVESARILKEIPFGLGSFAGAIVDALLGEKVNYSPVKDLSNSISYLIDSITTGVKGIGGLLKDLIGFADGGVVPEKPVKPTMDIFSLMNDVTSFTINKLLTPLVDIKINEVIRQVQDQSRKKDRDTAAPLTTAAAQQASNAEQEPPQKPEDGSSGTGGQSVGGNNIVEIGKDLISKGFAVAENPNFTKTPPKGSYTPGKGIVSPVHKGRGHYEGRAIDVTNWSGGDPAYKKAYLPILDSLQTNPNIKMLIHDTWGFYKDGHKSGPGNHDHPTHMHIETKFHGGPISNNGLVNAHKGEVVIDKDSVDIFGKDFFVLLNSIENQISLRKMSEVLFRLIENAAGENEIKSRDTDETITPIKINYNQMIKTGLKNKEEKRKEQEPNYSNVFSSKSENPKISFVDLSTKMPDLVTPLKSSVSPELASWARANRKMIERVGTKKQKEILSNVDLQDKIQGLYKDNKVEDRKETPEKKIAGGKIGKSTTTTPEINKFTSYNSPSNSEHYIIQPYIVESVSKPVNKTMGYPFVSSGGSVDNSQIERILSQLRA